MRRTDPPSARNAAARIAAARIGAVAALAAAALAPAAARAQACTAPAPGKVAPFSAGERLEFELSSVGAKIGDFSLQAAAGRGADAWIVVAKARTAPFAANFYEVDAKVEARLGRLLESRGYDENATEGGVNRTVSVSLPPPADGRLGVRATKQGNREDFALSAPAGTRDLVSVLYAARAMPLQPGAELCVPVFGARRIWNVRMKVVGKETVRTPAGEFRTLHLSGAAVRADRPAAGTREVHLWLSDDADRVPVAAFGLVQNKPVQAQLVRYEPGRRLAKAGSRR